MPAAAVEQIIIYYRARMEAKLRMRVEYEEPFSSQLEAPFVNVLPSAPLEAYKHFDQQRLAAIRQT